MYYAPGKIMFFFSLKIVLIICTSSWVNNNYFYKALLEYFSMDCQESMHAMSNWLLGAPSFEHLLLLYFNHDVLLIMVWFFISAQAKSALIRYKLFCICGFEMISINSVNFVFIFNGTSSMEIYQLTWTWMHKNSSLIDTLRVIWKLFLWLIHSLN